MLTKPAGCQGCALQEKGQGFAPADGPAGSWLLLVGEALGYTEALTGRPFMGDAGGMLQRLLNLLGWSRDAIRIHNTISCFPGDTIVEAAGVQRGYRRWYEGDVVTIETRAGVLTGTPNHPVLTQQGWIALGELHGGDYLVRGALSQGMQRSDPHVEYRPAPFAQVYEALAMAGVTRRVVGRTVDFHGDGGNGDVDVVALHRVLHASTVDPSDELAEELVLDAPDRPPVALLADRASFDTVADLLRALDEPTRRLVGGRYEGRTALHIEALPAASLRVGAIAELDPGGEQRRAQTRLTYAPLDRERRHALPRPIAADQVIKIKRTRYSGHVYNLQTTSAQYLANGFIVHNCHPPGDWFDERAPWYYRAMAHCPYLEATLAERHPVVVPMGLTAIRRVLHLEHKKKVRVQDFHGSVLRDPTDRFWVVPTYHPSFLQRGATNLIGTVLWDLKRAEQARESGRPASTHTLVIDPPVAWFKQWVDQVIAARTQDPGAYPLSSDIETPDKAGGQDEGEITADDVSYQLLRHNLACHPDEGVTVPHAGPYLDELKRLYASPGCIWMWNREYDFARQVHAGLLREEDSGKVVDLMWLAHFLQSDLPRGLGFWAPFYSDYGPWKHTASDEPAKYGAVDGLQTHRVGFGVVGDLVQQGQYSMALRHTHTLLSEVLRPAQLVGLKVDRARLIVFKDELAEKARARLQALQAAVPEALQPLTPKPGMTRRPAASVLHVKATAFTQKGTLRKGKPTAEIKQELYAKAVVVEQLVLREVLVCRDCGAVEVQRRHRCADPATAARAAHAPRLDVDVATVRRWFWQEPFNPDSVPQVLAYLKYRKHTPGRAKKSQSDASTNRETLERLSRTTQDPFYQALLDYRAIGKVKGTYVEGTERRLDSEDRLHPVPTFKPSTMRLSYVNPNITNVVADKGGSAGLAAGFRSCIVASPGCRLLEVDFSAIEAVETGWCARDAEYYRLAKLGVHAALVTHAIGQPYDPQASDAELRALFTAVKKRHPQVYEPAKRYIHGRSYGLTVAGMVLQFPHLFPTQASAEKFARVFEKMAPGVAAWQTATQVKASRQHYLGGEDHPFKYKHWFWSVYSYKRLTATQYYRLVKKYAGTGEPPCVQINGQWFRVSLGEDGKRVLAFYPQSIASGILKEAMLRLFADRESPSYLGEVYFGKTPLRAPIHDSLLLEIPDRAWDRTVEIVCREMQRPVIEQPLPASWGRGDGACVAIGVAAKAGHDWAAMEEIAVPGYESEWAAEAVEHDDAEDWAHLQRVI
jgi:uracil-DNA glycosylase